MSTSQLSPSPGIGEPTYHGDLNAAHFHSNNTSLLHFFNDFAHHISSHHYYPRFDVEEHGQSYELYGDLPGVQQASLKIETTNDHTIEISGTTLHHHGIASRDGQAEIPHDEAGAQVAASQPNIVFLANGKPAVPISNSKPAEPLSNVADGGELTKTHGHGSDQPRKGKKIKHLTTERQHGEFHRIFQFANMIKEKEVKAKYDNGILHVTVPKGPAPVKNEISVYWGGSMF